jgi:Mg2+/citrate symporter
MLMVVAFVFVAGLFFGFLTGGIFMAVMTNGRRIPEDTRGPYIDRMLEEYDEEA